MNTLRGFCWLLLLIVIGACQHPNAGKNWYKGNLHTHSYWSDGDEYPEMIMDWYKSNGYHFVALSDHNTLAEGERWIRVQENTISKNGYEDYLKKFGEEWVEYKEDSGRFEVRLKTFDEYRTLFEEPQQFLIIQAEEITDKFEGKPLHMNATNIQQFIQPKGGASVAEVLQNNINSVLEQRQALGVPIMPHINHPNFGYAISLQDMLQLKGERFFEVYNGHPLVNNQGDSTHMGTEQMWDQINISYLKQGKPLMYGVATDDSHHYHNQGAKYSNAGRGWVMVNADSLDAPSLIQAMEQGDFYASTGVTLTQIAVYDNKLHVEVKAEPNIKYEIEFIGCYKGDDQTRILFHNRIIKGEFALTPNLQFVRARVVSTKPMRNPVLPDEMEMAWTQPVAFAH